jgi:hypothetical protein
VERERAARIISSSKSTVLNMFSEARMGKTVGRQGCRRAGDRDHLLGLAQPMPSSAWPA